MLDLQVAPNGDVDHPAMPRTPEQIAADAAACVRAGATLLHLHVFDDDGQETLGGVHVARVLRAVRAVCPGTPINLTTFAAVVPDPAERLRLVESWTDLPDLVAANQGETRIDEVSAVLAARGVAVEACVLSVDDVRVFLRRGGWPHFAWLVVEPLEPVLADALSLSEEMEALLSTEDVGLPQLHHGVGAASWGIMRRAVTNGHAIRTGFEDTVHLEDGSRVESNTELVRAAAALKSAGGRGLRSEPGTSATG